MNRNFDLQILLPIHNEAESIEQTIREIYAEVSGKISIQFILCEDGSKDDTKKILRRVGEAIPAKLLLSESRKGYSRAVRDGMLENDAPYLLCLDSDGQCDPSDLWPLWENRNAADIHIGWRVHRADNALRRWMSGTFRQVWRALYHAPVHDPSCPFLLARQDVIRTLVPHLGAMEQGFWWEFIARSHRFGYSIREYPVHHRERSAGVTQVYKLRKLPGIGYRHFIALFKIWAETRPHVVAGLRQQSNSAMAGQLAALGQHVQVERPSESTSSSDDHRTRTHATVV